MPCLRASEKAEEKDVEEQVEEKESKVEAKPWCSKKLICILVTLTILAGAAIAAFWPQNVSWQLTNLDVLDQASLTFFVMAFSNGLSNNATLPDITFHAGAKIENPNFLGGTAESGEFKVLFQGKELGGGRSDPVDVPALGSNTVEADVRVKLNPTLFHELTTDVLANSLHTNITVQGGAMVKSIFGLQVRCRMKCDILASVSEIFGDTKQAVIEKKTCVYHYF